MDANDRDKSAGSEPAAKSPTLGQVLKAARSSRALTLEQLSTELRIEAPQLLALEQDQFERIGAPVFVKGYLRQYGQRVGLDYRELLGLYYQQVDQREIQIQPSRTIKLRDERQITVWIVAALVLAALVGSAVWWLNNSSTSISLFGLSGSLGAADRDVITSAVAATTESRRARAWPAQAASPAPMPSVAEASPAANDSAAIESSAAVEPAAGDGAQLVPPVVVPHGAMRLDVQFEQESWAEITDARGERLFYGLGRAGRQAPLAGEPPFTVLLGNGTAVRLTVNGADYPIPRSRRTDNLVRFTLAAPQD